MHIVINHLTRMRAGYMCAAGIDWETGQHIRPVLSSSLTTLFLRQNGGPFEVGALVDLGNPRSVGSPPEVEDYHFVAARVTPLRDLDSRDFWQLLEDNA